jgi:NitT/TauT family transport system substrate-binding protein
MGISRRLSRRSWLGSTAASLTAAPALAGAQSFTDLVVATAPVDDATPTLVGVRQGIYRRYGLNVSVQQFTSGAASAAAIAGGSIQIAGSSLVGLITAHVHNVPFQIVAPGSIYLTEKPPELLVVRKDSPYHSAADLNGKTIGSPALKDLLSTATLAWIEQNGGDAHSVAQVEIPPAATLAALENGRIDAAMIAEPRLSDALRSGNVRVLGKGYDAIGKRFLVSAEFAATAFCTDNRDVVARFARAHREANAFANAHPDQTAPWLAEFTKVDVDTVNRSTREQYDETLVLADIQRVIDFTARTKIIDRAFPAREMIAPAVL